MSEHSAYSTRLCPFLPLACWLDQGPRVLCCNSQVCTSVCFSCLFHSSINTSGIIGESVQCRAWWRWFPLNAAFPHPHSHYRCSMVVARTLWQEASICSLDSLAKTAAGPLPAPNPSSNALLPMILHFASPHLQRHFPLSLTRRISVYLAFQDSAQAPYTTGPHNRIAKPNLAL